MAQFAVTALSERPPAVTDRRYKDSELNNSELETAYNFP